MTITIPRSYGKAVGLVFTSLVAPLTIRFLDGSPEPPAPALEPIPLSAPADPPSPLAPATTRVVAKGTGPTAEAAFQNAVDSALQQSVAAEVTAAEWGRYGPTYLASVRRSGGGVLRGWRELSNVAERHLTGRVFRSEVAVEVDNSALRDRLRLAARP